MYWSMFAVPRAWSFEFCRKRKMTFFARATASATKDQSADTKKCTGFICLLAICRSQHHANVVCARTHFRCLSRAHEQKRENGSAAAREMVFMKFISVRLI